MCKYVKVDKVDTHKEKNQIFNPLLHPQPDFKGVIHVTDISRHVFECVCTTTYYNA